MAAHSQESMQESDDHHILPIRPDHRHQRFLKPENFSEIQKKAHRWLCDGIRECGTGTIDSAILFDTIRCETDSSKLNLSNVFLGKLVSFTFNGVKQKQRKQKGKRIHCIQGITWVKTPLCDKEQSEREPDENLMKVDACVQHDNAEVSHGKLREALRIEQAEKLSLQVDLSRSKRLSRANSLVLPDSLYFTDINEFKYNPVNSKSKTADPSGSYGYVQLFSYRGMDICMKYFHEQYDSSVALTEARALHNIRAHCGIPTLIGVYLVKPYRLMTSFHGMQRKSTTIKYVYDNPETFKFTTGDWLCVISNLVDALSNIHSSSYVHDDLKENNVIIEEGKSVVIIDFSKSLVITATQRKRFSNKKEQEEYHKKFPWVAPEIANGKGRPSFLSDIYSLGYLMSKIKNNAKLVCDKIDILIEQCMCVLPTDRISLAEVKTILKD